MARCLEAVSHAVGFGADGAAAGAHHDCHHRQHDREHAQFLLHSASVPNLGRPESQLSGPADSMDSGAAAHPGFTAAGLVPPSPLRGDGGFGGRALGMRGGALVSVGEDDRLTGHTDAVMSLACANGLLFSGGTDARIKVGAACRAWRGRAWLWRCGSGSGGQTMAGGCHGAQLLRHTLSAVRASPGPPCLQAPQGHPLRT